MPRIKIELPSSFIYEADIAVRVSDLNFGGHVGNDSMLTLLQEARINFYRSMGFKDKTRFEGSVGEIIADAAVQYKAESFFGDVLRIEIGVAELTRVGFDMVYKVTNKDTTKSVAFAKTGIVCFDYSAQKVAPIPQVLLEKLKVNNAAS